MTKCKPILFSPPMVRAILDGRKTQTRRLIPGRVLRQRIERELASSTPIVVGDVLWVRERWCKPFAGSNGYIYLADGPDFNTVAQHTWRASTKGVWKPSIHMPREACRLFFEVMDVRVQRLQDISEEDAIAEGVQTHAQHYGLEEKKLHGTTPWYRYDGEPCAAVSAVESFRTLWDSINGKRAPWASNPWVWAYTFKQVKGPQHGQAR